MTEIHLKNKAGNTIGYAICSPEDFEDFSKQKWSQQYGYAVTYMGEGKKMFMHQLVMKRKGETPDETMCIDHINNIRLDNKRENLRIVSKKQNSQNQKKRKKRTS
jgi:hypothetical protein